MISSLSHKGGSRISKREGEGRRVDESRSTLTLEKRENLGVDPGGGGWSWGTPKLHKEGKNVARARAKTPHFNT